MGKSRRQKIYDNNKRDILKAARVVFANKGYDKATISEIAAEADFSVGTIYNFFESKKELFEALTLDQFNAIMAGIEELRAKYPNPLQRLHYSFDFVCEMVENKKELMKIWFETSTYPIKEYKLSSSHGQMKALILKSTQKNFQEAIDQGYIKNNDVYCMTVALHSMIDGFLFEFMWNPEIKSLKELFDKVKTIFFESNLTDKGKLEFQK